MRVYRPGLGWCAIIAGALVILVSATSASCSTKSAAPALSNKVEGVNPFPMDMESGSMALHALDTSLEALGSPASYNRLAALSGSAFKFVYDTTEAYEPLRDLFPVDVLKNAAQANGFPDAHWEMDQPIDTVKAIVKREIDAGRSVLTSYIKANAYHGFFVITGYDYGRGVFKIQGAFADTAYTEVPIPASWSGPTASPMGWATNPIFVIGQRDPSKVPSDLDKHMVDQAIEILKGGELSYALTPGERQYVPSPGPHQAGYGLPAYRLLERDVGGAPLIVKKDGADSLNFGFIWRLDSQLGQLQDDRRYASIALDFLTSRVSSGKAIEVQSLSDNVEKTKFDAENLRHLFWTRIPDNVTTANAVAAYVKASKAMVFSLAAKGLVVDNLKSTGLNAFRSPWGPVVIDDSPAKRLGAKLLAKSLEARERVTLGALAKVSAYVAPDLGVQQPEPPKERRHKK